MLAYTSLHIKRFDGGLTDRVVDSSINTFKELYNYRLDKHANPIVREGFSHHKGPLGVMSRLLSRTVDGRITGISGTSIIYEREDGEIAQSVDPINPNLTDDDNISSFLSRGIRYVTTTQNSLSNSRQHLYSMYSEEVPISGHPDTYKVKSQQTGCPRYERDIDADISATDDPRTIYFYVVYRQSINANNGTGDSVTQDSLGRGSYSSETRAKEDTESIIVYPADFSDYDETPYVDVYRTHPSDSSVYYLVDSVQPTTAPITVNSITDAALLENQRLYISEGIIEMEQPPKHTCSAIVNNTAFYGNIEVVENHSGTSRIYTEYSYKIMQSMVGNPSMVSYSFTYDFEDAIEGMVGIGNSLIVFTKTKVYRVDGLRGNDGSGAYSVRTISDNAGCVSHKGIISVDSRVYFCGETGAYVTDGYQVSSISVTNKYDISETYRSYMKDYVDEGEGARPIDIRRRRVTAYHDPDNTCIYWAVCSLGSLEPTELITYDIYNKCFYKFGGNGAYFCSMMIEDDTIYRGDRLSHLYVHHDQYKDDVILDITESDASLWNHSHVPHSLKTSPIDFGDPSIKKWVQAITATITTKSKVAMKIVSYNDNGSAGKDLKEIVITSVLLWRDINLRWRDPVMKWRTPSTSSRRRHFPKRGLRCRYKQFEIMPTESVQYTSELLGTAAITPVSPTEPDLYFVDLEEVGKTWPEDVVGYSISLEIEDYQIGYLIREVNNIGISRIKIGGGSNMGTTTGNAFKISGIRKKQSFSIENITLQYAPLQNVGADYRGKDE